MLRSDIRNDFKLKIEINLSGSGLIHIYNCEARISKFISFISPFKIPFHNYFIPYNYISKSFLQNVSVSYSSDKNAHQISRANILRRMGSCNYMIPKMWVRICAEISKITCSATFGVPARLPVLHNSPRCCFRCDT